jgi:hypothetical protein
MCPEETRFQPRTGICCLQVPDFQFLLAILHLFHDLINRTFCSPFSMCRRSSLGDLWKAASPLQIHSTCANENLPQLLIKLQSPHCQSVYVKYCPLHILKSIGNEKWITAMPTIRPVWHSLLLPP